MAMYGLRVYVGFTYKVLAVQGCWTLLGGSFMGLDNYFRGGYWIHRVCICNLTRFEQIFSFERYYAKNDCCFQSYSTLGTIPM